MTIASVLMKDTLINESPPFVFGGSGDWAIYIGKQPDSPNRCITIYDAPGLAPNPRWLLDEPSVQFRVRGGRNDYKVVADKTVEVRNRLLGRPSYNAFDGLGDRIVMITAIGDWSFNGFDDVERPEFIFNLKLIIEPAPSTTPTYREPL